MSAGVTASRDGLGFTGSAKQRWGVLVEDRLMDKLKFWVRILFSGFLVWVGVLHFITPRIFVDIMPPALSSYALSLVYISGLFEVLGGVGLLLPRTRRLAGWGVIALLIAVFPANIHMAINDVPFRGEHLSAAVRWGRLPFQFLFIAVAYWTSQESGQEGEGTGALR